jgi:hypothetical protein
MYCEVIKFFSQLDVFKIVICRKFKIERWSIGIASNVHSFVVGGAILLRRPGRRVLNCYTKDKIIFKSLIDKCQPEQKLNRITGDDRRFASPPAAAKLHVACCTTSSIVNT